MNDLSVVIQSFPFLLQGLLNTLWVSLIVLILAIVFGALIAFVEFSALRPIKFLIAFIINVGRGFPLVVEIFMIFYGLPALGINIPRYPSVILAMAVFFTCSMAEVFRGGITSVDEGQFQAAKSLGMNYWQMMRRIIIPQTIRLVISPTVGQFTAIIKGTSLISLLGLYDLLKAGSEIIERTLTVMPMYIAIALLYVAVCASANRLGQTLEKKLAFVKK